jgi:hypothetical protein
VQVPTYPAIPPPSAVQPGQLFAADYLGETSLYYYGSNGQLTMTGGAPAIEAVQAGRIPPYAAGYGGVPTNALGENSPYWEQLAAQNGGVQPGMSLSGHPFQDPPPPVAAQPPAQALSPSPPVGWSPQASQPDQSFQAFPPAPMGSYAAPPVPQGPAVAPGVLQGAATAPQGPQVAGSAQPQQGATPAGGPQSYADQQLSQLPLSPAFEAQRRAVNDQLSATLAQIGVAQQEIPAMVNMITARMSTQQGLDTNRLNESMIGRGLYDSSIRQQDTGYLNADYDRGRQDVAMDAVRQYRDLATQQSQARTYAEQQLAEMLLALAQETLGDPSAPVEGTSPFGLDYPDLGGVDPGFSVPSVDLPRKAAAGGRKRTAPATGKRRKK